MYVYIVTGDSRERDHDQVQSVRSSLADAYEDAKRYILRNNDEDYVQADKAMAARKFVAKYASPWLTCGSIVRRKVR